MEKNNIEPQELEQVWTKDFTLDGDIEFVKIYINTSGTINLIKAEIKDNNRGPFKLLYDNNYKALTLSADVNVNFKNPNIIIVYKATKNVADNITFDYYFNPFDI